MVCSGFGASIGKALILTGISGFAYCIQAAINGKFCWGDLAQEVGVTFISACLFPYVESFGGRVLLTTAITFIKEGLNCLLTGVKFDVSKTATSALIAVISLGVNEIIGVDKVLYGASKVVGC